MIFPKISTSVITANLLAVHLAPSVDSHGYLLTPCSRNYRASIEGKWYGGMADTPAIETEPQSLNIAVQKLAVAKYTTATMTTHATP
jgi:hypothetical protein